MSNIIIPITLVTSTTTLPCGYSYSEQPSTLSQRSWDPTLHEYSTISDIVTLYPSDCPTTTSTHPVESRTLETSPSQVPSPSESAVQSSAPSLTSPTGLPKTSSTPSAPPSTISTTISLTPLSTSSSFLASTPSQTKPSLTTSSVSPPTSPTKPVTTLSTASSTSLSIPSATSLSNKTSPSSLTTSSTLQSTSSPTLVSTTSSTVSSRVSLATSPTSALKNSSVFTSFLNNSTSTDVTKTNSPVIDSTLNVTKTSIPSTSTTASVSKSSTPTTSEAAEPQSSTHAPAIPSTTSPSTISSATESQPENDPQPSVHPPAISSTETTLAMVSPTNSQQPADPQPLAHGQACLGIMSEGRCPMIYTSQVTATFTETSQNIDQKPTKRSESAVTTMLPSKTPSTTHPMNAVGTNGVVSLDGPRESAVEVSDKGFGSQDHNFGHMLMIPVILLSLLCIGVFFSIYIEKKVKRTLVGITRQKRKEKKPGKELDDFNV